MRLHDTQSCISYCCFVLQLHWIGLVPKAGFFHEISIHLLVFAAARSLAHTPLKIDLICQGTPPAKTRHQYPKTAAIGHVSTDRRLQSPDNGWGLQTPPGGAGVSRCVLVPRASRRARAPVLTGRPPVTRERPESAPGTPRSAHARPPRRPRRAQSIGPSAKRSRCASESEAGSALAGQYGTWCARETAAWPAERQWQAAPRGPARRGH